MSTQFLFENLEGRDQSEDKGVDRGMILKWIFRK
jgi:hypothetical protein